MVKLGVRVIHKIAATVRCPAELTSALNAPAPHHVATVLMPKTLLLRITQPAVVSAVPQPSDDADDVQDCNNTNSTTRNKASRLNHEVNGAPSRIDVKQRGHSGQPAGGGGFSTNDAKVYRICA